MWRTRKSASKWSNGVELLKMAQNGKNEAHSFKWLNHNKNVAQS